MSKPNISRVKAKPAPATITAREGFIRPPWVIDRENDNGILDVRNTDAPFYCSIRGGGTDRLDPYHIARVWSDVEGAEANARLIAAAPEFYAVAEFALTAKATSPWAQELQALAKLAIAKMEAQ